MCYKADGLFIIDINGKNAMCVVCLFGINSKWTKNVEVWEKLETHQLKKTVKPVSDELCLSGMVLWVKHVYFQPDDIAGVLKLEELQDINNGIDVCIDNGPPIVNVTPSTPGGSVTWNDPMLCRYLLKEGSRS